LWPSFNASLLLGLIKSGYLHRQPRVAEMQLIFFVPINAGIKNWQKSALFSVFIVTFAVPLGVAMQSPIMLKHRKVLH
jgi:hypothetical protein